VIYVDSSVVLAALFAEDRSPPESFWQETLTSSRLLEYEVFNRIHARRLTQSYLEDARTLVGQVALIDLRPSMLARALEPFPIAVRTLDALHLATMDFLRRQGHSAQLASYDRRLITAAEALGMTLATV
jgi:predicted nucleic acid-binding protein